MTPCPSPTPNCATTSPDAPKVFTCGTPLTLRLRGVGNVIPFKNRKRAIVSKDKSRAFLVTESDVKAQMNAITDSFVSQLTAAFRTANAGTWTAARLRSWIVSVLPDDDCWTCVPRLPVSGDLVPLGEEGADLIIERLDAHQLLLDESK